MHRLEARLFLRPLKEREFRNPDKAELVLVEEFQLARKLHAERTEHVKDRLVLIRREEQKVAVLAAHGRNERLHLLFLHKLRKRGLQASVLLNRDIGEALCAVALCKFDKRVDLLSRHMALAVHAYAAHAAARR